TRRSQAQRAPHGVVARAGRGRVLSGLHRDGRPAQRALMKNDTQKANRKLTWQLWLFAAGFLAFGLALVALYNVLCDVTGYGDRSKLRQAATVVEAPDESRTLTIELVSSVPTFGSWEFHPLRTQVEVHPGKLSEAKFYARNLRDQPVTAQA